MRSAISAASFVLLLLTGCRPPEPSGDAPPTVRRAVAPPHPATPAPLPSPPGPSLASLLDELASSCEREAAFRWRHFDFFQLFRTTLVHRGGSPGTLIAAVEQHREADADPAKRAANGWALEGVVVFDLVETEEPGTYRVRRRTWAPAERRGLLSKLLDSGAIRLRCRDDVEVHALPRGADFMFNEGAVPERAEVAYPWSSPVTQPVRGRGCKLVRRAMGDWTHITALLWTNPQPTWTGQEATAPDPFDSLIVFAGPPADGAVEVIEEHSLGWEGTAYRRWTRDDGSALPEPCR